MGRGRRRHPRGGHRLGAAIFAALLLLAAAPAGAAEVGLRLTYKARFRGIPVGRSSYTWVHRGGFVWLAKELDPRGPLAHLYRVRDRFVAKVTPEGRPLLLYEYIEEPKGRRQDRWSRVDWESELVTLVRHDFRDGSWDRRVVPAVQGFQWPLTVPYWLLQLDPGRIDGLRIPLLDGDKVKELHLRLAGHKRLRTGLGRIDCDRVEGEVWYRSRPQPHGSFTAWVRREAPRIPARIVSHLRFGTLSETVIREEPATTLPDLPAMP